MGGSFINKSLPLFITGGFPFVKSTKIDHDGSPEGLEDPHSTFMESHLPIPKWTFPEVSKLLIDSFFQTFI